MAAITVRTFQEITDAVLRRVKIPSTDTDALEACKEFVNTRYDSIAYRKKWRWRRARWDMRIEAKYVTGTVTATNGSRTITGASTAWDTNKKGWWINFTGYNECYEVAAINGQTIELSALYNGTTGAGKTYTLFKFQYGLPPDCEEIDLVWHDHYPEPAQICAPREIWEYLIRNPLSEGKVEAVTAYGSKSYDGPPLGEFLLGYDFLGGSDSDDLMLTVYPMVPDENHTLHIEYTKRATPLDAATDEPIIPREKRQILLYGALADMFSMQRADDTAAFWERKFNQELQTMENDTEYTDEKPKIVINRNRWKRRRYLVPSNVDMGRRFDRE